MKTKILFSLIAITSAAILTSCKPRIFGQIVPDLVKPSENIRIVNGQLYDGYHSELWKNPLELAGFHSHANENFRLVTYQAKVEIIAGDKIQCGVYALAHWPPVANGEVESEEMVQEIVIYQYPNAESLVSGQLLGDCRCMRVANYNAFGISYAAFDCGVQSTALVPVIKNTMVKVGGVQIFLVDAKEASDFLQKKKNESDARCSQIMTDMEALKLELATNQSDLLKVQNIANQPYTNDASYVALLKETQGNIKTLETLAHAVNFLRAKYGDPPELFTQHYPQAQLDAWQAIRVDIRRIQSIRQRANQIDVEDDALPQKIKNKQGWQLEAVRAAIQTTQKKLDEANQALKFSQSPDFYLGDFSPSFVQTCVSDADGNFQIINPKLGTKLFAKIKPDGTGEGFFWLVDMPPLGGKLILCETNLFSTSANYP